MLLDEYQQLAARTRNRSLPLQDERACYAIGLSSEAGEGAEALVTEPGKVVKELGDVLWYTATVADTYDIQLHELAPYGVYDFVGVGLRTVKTDDGVLRVMLKLGGHAGTAADYLKKVLFHGHIYDGEKLRALLALVFKSIGEVADMNGVSFESVATENIAKLRARYPAGFSEAASANRAPSDI